MREMVLLPTPEGPQRTMSRPLFRWAGIALFHVLYLLLQAVDGPLDLHDVAGDLGVVGLAGDGVGLAEHFLADEVELAAGVLAVAAGLLEGPQVARQPLDLLGDVRALREHRHLLDQVR